MSSKGFWYWTPWAVAWIVPSKGFWKSELCAEPFRSKLEKGDWDDCRLGRSKDALAICCCVDMWPSTIFIKFADWESENLFEKAKTFDLLTYWQHMRSLCDWRDLACFAGTTKAEPILILENHTLENEKRKTASFNIQFRRPPPKCMFISGKSLQELRYAPSAA